MSSNSLEKAERAISEVKPQKDNIKQKEDLIDPLTLLSSDLLKEIDNIEEKNLDEKKETKTADNIQLDDTQKESDEDDDNEEDEENISDTESNFDKDLYNFQIFQNDNKEKKENEDNKGLEKTNEPKIKPKQQSSIYLNSINLNSFNNDSSSFLNETRSFSYDYNLEQNKNNLFNPPINDFNDVKNQFQFYNNSFTMNGRNGWVCTHCKNFNFESKLIIIFIILHFFFCKLIILYS